MSITIAVCTRERPDRLAQWAAHMTGVQGIADTPVIVVDQSAAPYRGLLPGAVHYLHRPGRGLAHARNTALAAATTTHVCFCDDDCLPAVDWIATATQLCERDPAVALWYGATDPSGRDFQLHAQTTPAGTLNWATRGDGAVCQALRVAAHATRGHVPTGVLEHYGQGNNCIVAVAAARRNGGFRTFLGAGTLSAAGEDVEYTLRLLARGHEVAYDPRLRLSHDAWQPAARAESHAHGYTTGMVAVHVWYAWYGIAAARADVASRLGLWRVAGARTTPPTAQPRSLRRYAAHLRAAALGCLLGCWYALRHGRPW